jgi:phage gp36-like protein
MEKPKDWITKEEGKNAAYTLYKFMKQYETVPAVYQQSSLCMIGIRLLQIEEIQKNMRKNYKQQIKQLEKEKKITYISKNEFYYN